MRRQVHVFTGISACAPHPGSGQSSQSEWLHDRTRLSDWDVEGPSIDDITV